MCNCRVSAIFLLAFVCCLFFRQPVLAATPAFSIQVLTVFDGDSLEGVSAGEKIKLRLWGIDAPEWRQTYGRLAQALLAAMVKGRRITVRGQNTDPYKRLVALVWVDGVLVNEEMVRRGAAWVYERFCREHICQTWRLLQEEARRERRGLWNMPNPRPPWQYRKRGS